MNEDSPGACQRCRGRGTLILKDDYKPAECPACRGCGSVNQYPREQEYINALGQSREDIEFLLSAMRAVNEANKDAKSYLAIKVLIEKAQSSVGMVATVAQYWQNWKDEFAKAEVEKRE